MSRASICTIPGWLGVVLGVSVIFSPFLSYAVYVCSCCLRGCATDAEVGADVELEVEGVTRSNMGFVDGGAAAGGDVGGGEDALNRLMISDAAALRVAATGAEAV